MNLELSHLRPASSSGGGGGGGGGDAGRAPEMLTMKTVGVASSSIGVPGCSKAFQTPKCNHRAPGVTLCPSVHPHHHHRPTRVSSVAAALVLAVVGAAPAAARDENDLHHVRRAKVGDAAQTPKIGSAGRQNCSLGRQCSHWNKNRNGHNNNNIRSSSLRNNNNNNNSGEGDVESIDQQQQRGRICVRSLSEEEEEEEEDEEEEEEEPVSVSMESSVGSGESPSPQQQTVMSMSRLRMRGNLRHFHHHHHVHHQHLHPHHGGQVFSFDHVMPVMAAMTGGSATVRSSSQTQSDEEGEEEVFSPGLGLTPSFSDRSDSDLCDSSVNANASHPHVTPQAAPASWVLTPATSSSLTSPPQSISGHLGHLAPRLSREAVSPIMAAPLSLPGSNPGFGCEICGQIFDQHDRLVKHLASRHKLPVQQQQQPPQPQQLHRAMSVAGDSGVVVKGYQCDVCQRPFARSDMLTRHMRLHTGLKPYTCRICGQVFSRSDHLSTHQRTHTGEKPYRCPQCSYAACRRDMITRHLRTHTRSEDLDGLSDPRKDSG
nr:EOG090X0G73 [Ceriodaphnia reticulata]